MINNSTYLTTKCKCDKPNHCVVQVCSVKNGKNFGKVKYLIYCENCHTQWWSFSEKYINVNNRLKGE